MIGLGGTGKEVLLRLRRRLVERYGELSRLPFLQFMHIDTDKTATAHEQYDLRAGDDPLYEQVRFQANERVNLTIPGGTAKYTDHLNQFPQIKRWFPGGGKIASLGDLGEGAGQIRIASRLGFFDATNFRNIGSRLKQCKDLLNAASVPQQANDLGFEFAANSPRVFVIASLAGGTGSGTFLDIAFLVRQYFATGERVGMFLLPG
ncbi:MAG TPA: tubulin-like doman-containing protein, partial [Thermoanaerobaculia bacterium]